MLWRFWWLVTEHLKAQGKPAALSKPVPQNNFFLRRNYSRSGAVGSRVSNQHPAGGDFHSNSVLKRYSQTVLAVVLRNVATVGWLVGWLVETVPTQALSPYSQGILAHVRCLLFKGCTYILSSFCICLKYIFKRRERHYWRAWTCGKQGFWKHLIFSANQSVVRKWHKACIIYTVATQ